MVSWAAFASPTLRFLFRAQQGPFYQKWARVSLTTNWVERFGFNQQLLDSIFWRISCSGGLVNLVLWVQVSYGSSWSKLQAFWSPLVRFGQVHTNSWTFCIARCQIINSSYLCRILSRFHQLISDGGLLRRGRSYMVGLAVAEFSRHHFCW